MSGYSARGHENKHQNKRSSRMLSQGEPIPHQTRPQSFVPGHSGYKRTFVPKKSFASRSSSGGSGGGNSDVSRTNKSNNGHRYYDGVGKTSTYRIRDTQRGSPRYRSVSRSPENSRTALSRSIGGHPRKRQRMNWGKKRRAEPGPRVPPTNFKTYARVLPVENTTLSKFSGRPHTDDYQAKLEGRIRGDLAPFTSQLQRRGELSKEMRKIAREKKKFCRSAVIVSIKNDANGSSPKSIHGTISIELPSHFTNDTSDNRRKIYKQMVLDLDIWCAHHGLPLPAMDFVIYATDTYVWERYASMYPWLIMAKPANRNGVLIPDNSFISHDVQGGECEEKAPTHISANNDIVKGRESGGDKRTGNDVERSTSNHAEDGIDTNSHLPCMPSYAWDKVKSKMQPYCHSDAAKKEKVLFFKGANTGADKYATRLHLQKLQDQGTVTQQLPLQIDLLGSKQPMYEWTKKLVLLNLPGHQPWSYRRKYLFLLKSVVFNIDTRVEYTPDDVTEKWELFFDHVFEPGQDFVALTQYAYDEKHQNFRQGTHEKLKKLVNDLIVAYKGISPDDQYVKMVTSAFAKATALTTSRILQYFYVVLLTYAQLSIPSAPRTELDELIAADPKTLSVEEIANLQKAAQRLLNSTF